MIVLFAIFIAKKKQSSEKKTVEYDYKKKKPLTNNEQNMYWRLIQTLPDHVVLTQVGMSRCVTTKGQAAFNTISKKSLDFVICNRSLEIIAAIEIDDKSHTTATRQKADKTKNKALELAGIKLIRWPANPLPSTEIILRTLSNEV